MNNTGTSMALAGIEIGQSKRREFSLLPFWFWNDELREQELLRQIDDFQAHGVHGFVIHPRVGLPRNIGWMSERMLHFVRVAVEAAATREMRVVLYDEAMYPSGSSCGQVVAADERFRCRGLVEVPLGQAMAAPRLPAGQNLLAIVTRHDGTPVAIVDRPVDSVIRGIHYIADGPAEDEPPAADLLNPEAVAMFVHLVYDRFYEALGDHFGKTIVGIFTDEPDLLGRLREPRETVKPGTTGILENVIAFLGYDFTPHLPSLWHDDEPDALKHRADYFRAVNHCMEQSYYSQLSRWCRQHQVSLMGHPSKPDEIGLMRHFDVPGQDLVWRHVMPGESSALEGPQSTQAKCSSSAMIHLGRRRNSNEFCGAYGHELTFEQMRWLANWCLVRGVNMLIPHAFYYSTRGCRKDERPPDVGPNSPWWNEGFRDFAEDCVRGCWLNTDSRHVCDIAILGESDRLPWEAAKVCLQHQRDFNYLDVQDLAEGRAVVSAEGICVAGMLYRVLIVDGDIAIPRGAAAALRTLDAAGKIVTYQGARELLTRLDELTPSWLQVEPAQVDLRCRRVIKEGCDYLLLFNEGVKPMHCRVGWGREMQPLELGAGELTVIHMKCVR